MLLDPQTCISSLTSDSYKSIFNTILSSAFYLHKHLEPHNLHQLMILFISRFLLFYINRILNSLWQKLYRYPYSLLLLRFQHLLFKHFRRKYILDFFL
jgi:hypothetical protein